MNFNTAKRKKLNLPSYTLSEEIINAITHGLGAIFAVFALVLLILKHHENIADLICVSIYGATLFITYLISTLYHSLKPNRAKAVFRKLDHCSIFLLIAGTYTPLCLLYIKSNFVWPILVGVWITACTGVVLNGISVNKFSKVSLACYIVMGWSITFIMKPVTQSLNPTQIKFLIAGGIVYTVGAILYVLGKKSKYIHSVWHVFVLIGSVLHFFTIY